ncbi:MAG: hypothetical protein A2516_10185 [Alphaproteobacteria bacterium RIFOXYD12_FULL_60_8]|nr:MAG: hypothetical protein A2516_10185 [Alphaproteobacteria bacterium RIFOXYD12_FULL_60_8]
MSVRLKILAILIVLLALIGVSMTVVLTNVSRQLPLIQETDTDIRMLASSGVPLVDIIQQVRSDVIQVQQWLSDISATRGRDGLADGFDLAEEYAQKFHDDIDQAREYMTDLQLTELLPLLDKVESKFPPYYATGKKMAQAYIDQGPEGGNPIMGEFDTVAEAINTDLDTLVEDVRGASSGRLVALVERGQAMKSQSEALSTTLTLLTAIALAIGIGGSIYLYRLFSTRMSDLEHDIAVISGTSDNALRMNAKTRDEFGAIALRLQEVKSTLDSAEVLRRDQAAAKTKAEADRKALLTRLADSLEAEVQAIVKNVSLSAQTMQMTAEAMTDSATDASRQSSVVATAAGEASANVETVASAAEELSASVRDVSQRLSQSTEVTQVAVHEAKKTTEIVEGLAQAVDKISEVVQLITDIADQTNLLALNATIEAARAGDAGKGFAVVAGEVKNLASQTAKATSDISSHVMAVQGSMGDALVAIESITGVVDEVNGIAADIQHAVQEQGEAILEIARNVQLAAGGARRVTDAIGGVNQAAQETGQASAQVLNSSVTMTQSLTDLASKVSEAVDKIRTS